MDSPAVLQKLATQFFQSANVLMCGQIVELLAGALVVIRASPVDLVICGWRLRVANEAQDESFAIAAEVADLLCDCNWSTIELPCSSVQEILEPHSERVEESAQISPWTRIIWRCRIRGD